MKNRKKGRLTIEYMRYDDFVPEETYIRIEAPLPVKAKMDGSKVAQVWNKLVISK
jgi:hypothetical protein